MRTTVLLALACTFAASSQAQDKLLSWPIWKSYQKDASDNSGLIKSGTAFARWVDDSHLAYQKADGWWVVELPSGKETKAEKEPAANTAPGRRNPNGGRRSPGRGGQYDEAFSGDGKVKASYKDGNVSLSKDGGADKPVTTDGDVAKKVKYGKGSWVYGEELDQTEAMGLNADGSLLWYYRFDETPVIDNFVVMNQSTPHPKFEQQAYPKPGSENPVVDLYICDTATLKSVKVKVRPGTFDTGVGHYVYDMRWSPSGKELLFRRTDRRQKTMELCSADPATGDVRVIVHEEWPQSYTENRFGIWF